MPTAAELPEDLASLARRNAIELSDTRWDYDVGRLVTVLQQMPGPAAPVATRLRVQPSGRQPLVWAAAAVALLVVGGLVIALASRGSGSSSDRTGTPVALSSGIAATQTPAVAALGPGAAATTTPTAAPTLTATPAPTASATPPPPPTTIPSPPPTPVPAPGKSTDPPPRSIVAGQWTSRFRVQSNECPFGPRPGEIQTLAVTFSPATGNAPYIQAGERFMFNDFQGTRWGPFILTWPRVELTIPDDDHDHIHYYFDFTGPNSATSEAIFHQVTPPECRIRFTE
jgi:hypothetical protein